MVAVIQDHREAYGVEPIGDVLSIASARLQDACSGRAYGLVMPPATPAGCDRSIDANVFSAVYLRHSPGGSCAGVVPSPGRLRLRDDDRDRVDVAALRRFHGRGPDEAEGRPRCDRRTTADAASVPDCVTPRRAPNTLRVKEAPRRPR